MNLINTTSLEYPRSIGQLRHENPNVSFPAQLSDEDLAAFNHANVHPSPQPEHDSRTERLEEGNPTQSDDGRWFQSWTVRPASEQELADYDRVNTPAPDWVGFAVALIHDPTIETWFNALPRAVANGLSIGLNEVSKSNPDMFLRLWSSLTPSVPTAVPVALSTLASQHYLPLDFIDALSTASAAA